MIRAKNISTFIAIIAIVFFMPFQAEAEKEYHLSLDEVTKLALNNNFDIQLAKYDAWIARTDNDVARSIYDTMFEALVEYRDDESKQTSTIQEQPCKHLHNLTPSLAESPSTQEMTTDQLKARREQLLKGG